MNSYNNDRLLDNLLFLFSFILYFLDTPLFTVSMYYGGL